MKITIEPSFINPSIESGHVTVSINTHTNDDSTPEIVAACLDLLKSAGHAQCNIADAAIEYGKELNRAFNKQD